MRKILLVIVIFGGIILVGYLIEYGRAQQQKRLAVDPEKNVLHDTLMHTTRARNAVTQLNLKSSLVNSIARFTIDEGRMPTSLDELIETEYIARTEIEDVFGRDFRSRIDGTNLIIESRGQDGIWNTADDILLEVPMQ
jgi:hypothetical protein